MKNLNKYLLSSALVVGSALAASTAMAADKGFYVVPTVGYHHTDDERPVSGATGYQDDVTYGLGIGYQFSPKMAVEVQYNYTDAEYDDNGVAAAKHDAEFEYIHADLLYSLPKFGPFEPYVVAGIGENEIDIDISGVSNRDETMANAGIGYHVSVAKNLRVRFDVRAQHSLDDEVTDATANLGLNWLAFPVAAAVAAPKPMMPKDSDGDGVVDARDKCPNTKAGAKVDVNGCEIVKELTETKTFTMYVNFDFDSTGLTSGSVSEIQELAAFMKQYPKSPVVLEGHTDSIGSAAYNQGLSESRAAAVGQALVAQFGINPARISTVGYGETKPVATNATAEGRAKNRRTVGNVQATVKVK